MNPNYFSNKGQGTIEYLVVIAIVIVIALAVVVIITNFLSTGDSFSSTSQNISQMSGALSITESIVSTSGQYALKVGSNESKPITIDKIYVNDIEQTYTGNNNLTTGNSKIFPLYLSETCVNGSTVIKNIKIEYTPTTGLKKTVIIENMTIPCEDYTLTSKDLASVAESSKIILYSPGDNSTLAVGSTITFNYLATNVGTDTNYCNLIIDELIDQTVNSPPSGVSSFSKTFNTVGEHTWNIECENLLGYISTASNGPWDFEIQSSPPAINLISPSNNAVSYIGDSTTLTYSAIDPDGIKECRLIINGEPKVTASENFLPGSFNYVFDTLGQHTWNIECEDIYGSKATAVNDTAPRNTNTINFFSCSTDSSDVTVTSLDFFGHETSADSYKPALCIGLTNNSLTPITSWCGGVRYPCGGQTGDCTGTFSKSGICSSRGCEISSWKNYYGFSQAMEYGSNSNGQTKGCYISTIIPDEEVHFCTQLADPNNTMSMDPILIPRGTNLSGTIEFTTNIGQIILSCSGPVSKSYYATGSCPFLYVYGDEGMSLVNDVFPQSMLGVLNELGRRKPYPNDLVIIDKPFDEINGKYLLEVKQTPDEVSYIDATKLSYVDIPTGFDIAPGAASFTTNWELEGTKAIQDETITLHTISLAAKPPKNCIDQFGNNCLNQISNRDYIIEFEEEYKFIENEAIIGRQFEWDLIELDLGNLSNAEDIKLVMSGVTAWPSTEEWSSNPNATGTKPAFIEVLDKNGDWVFATYMPIPNGYGKLFAFPIKNIFKINNYKIRLNIFAKSDIDLILVDTTLDKKLNLIELELDKAEVYNFGTGKGYEGMATQYGEVNPLLKKVDDMFAILVQGDGIRLLFNTEQTLPNNNTQRKYIFEINGYFKQAKYGLDRTIEPLPF
ncbi:MAG: hypothetical protein PHX27_03855, partial [Candidatus ainarchaeum sp.]|nr:hypothetical protein [Candidatus ainarchaeum sp.]